MSMGNAEDLLKASNATLDARMVAGGYVYDLRTARLENQKPKTGTEAKMCSLSRGDIQAQNTQTEG